jgi:tetratricopeptide (TPR) repeat protein
MLAYLLILIVAAVSGQQAQTILQQSSGWCSPNIANVAGNVTVNCKGVDPRALRRLNAELKRKNLQVADATRNADEWTVRYKELETRLSAAADDGILSRQAEKYLHEGQLEKAGAILDQILAREEKQIAQTAANHYNRGLIFELEFLPLQALPHLEKAYQYRPENVKYNEEYAVALLDQNDFTRAEPVLLAAVAEARQLAKANPDASKPDLAKSLNNLGFGYYRRIGQTEKAEEELCEALDIYIQLADTNPLKYKRNVAETLNNLGILYSDLQQFTAAEESYQKALDTLGQLPDARGIIDQLDVAKIYNNLGNLYRDTHKMKKAETAYLKALYIYQQLMAL